MKDTDTIRRLKESMESAKQLRKDLELNIRDVSKLIESAKRSRNRGKHVAPQKRERAEK